MTSGGSALRRVGVRWLLALATPALFGLYSSVAGLSLILYVALVPWLILYTDDRHPRVSLGYFVVAAWVTLLLLYVEMFRFGWQFTVGFVTVFMLPWLVYAPLQRRIHHRLHLPRTWTVAVVWVTVELVRAIFTLSHFDLFRFGNSQAGLTPLVQIADVTGEYGISFLVAAVNGLVADLYFALREHGWRSRRGWLARRNVLSAAMVAAMFVGAWIYGVARLMSAEYQEGPRIAIVQPNIRHLMSNAVGVHLAQILMTEDGVEPGAADIIAWPENAILDNIRRPGAYLEDLARLSREKSAWFVVGSMGKSREQPGYSLNGAFLVDPEGEIEGEYYKQVMFPWSEFVPLDGLLGRIAPGLRNLHRTLIRRGWGFLPSGLPGDEMVLLRYPWKGGELPFGALICLENAHPPIPAEAGRRGARFFVNITSEGEVGGSLQLHMLRTCMLRAVENRISYVRVGNTGVSCFIDPSGRVQSLLRGVEGRAILDSGILIDRVMLSRGGPTLYALSRDAFAKACAGATLLLLVWTWLRRKPVETSTAGS